MMAPKPLCGGAYMDRRGFMKRLLQGGACLPLMPAMAMAASPRNVIVQQSPIAGFQYYDGERVFADLWVDSPLSLVREAGNKHDKNAVAVYFKYHKLGFVPRADNTAIAQMLDRGERLSAEIIELEISKNPWERVRFEVVLHG